LKLVRVVRNYVCLVNRMRRRARAPVQRQECNPVGWCTLVAVQRPRSQEAGVGWGEGGRNTGIDASCCVRGGVSGPALLRNDFSGTMVIFGRGCSMPPPPCNRGVFVLRKHKRGTDHWRIGRLF